MRTKLSLKPIFLLHSKSVWLILMLILAGVILGCPQNITIPPLIDDSSCKEIKLKEKVPGHEELLKGERGGEIFGKQQIDCYRINVKKEAVETGFLTYSVTPLSPHAKLVIVPSELGKPISFKEKEPKPVGVKVQQKGTYYAQVLTMNEQSTKYTIVVQFDKNAIFEGSSSLKEIDGGELDFDKGDSIDWYKVEKVEKDGKLTFALKQTSDTVDTVVIVKVYDDPAKNLIGKEELGGKNGKYSYDIDVHQGKTYYAELSIEKTPGKKCSYTITRPSASQSNKYPKITSTHTPTPTPKPTPILESTPTPISIPTHTPTPSSAPTPGIKQTATIKGEEVFPFANIDRKDGKDPIELGTKGFIIILWLRYKPLITMAIRPKQDIAIEDIITSILFNGETLALSSGKFDEKTRDTLFEFRLTDKLQETLIIQADNNEESVEITFTNE